MFIIWGSIIYQLCFDRPRPHCFSKRLFTCVRGSFLHNVLNSVVYPGTIQMSLLCHCWLMENHIPSFFFQVIKEKSVFWMNEVGALLCSCFLPVLFSERGGEGKENIFVGAHYSTAVRNGFLYIFLLFF